MEPDWTFHIDDASARYSVPPDEVRLPLQAAVARPREATEACRTAALELGEVPHWELNGQPCT
jgi:hypothetical protein